MTDNIEPSTPQLAQTAAEAAANWWAEVLVTPTYEAGVPLASAFAERLRARQPVILRSSPELADFAARLARKLDSLLKDEDAVPPSGIRVAVDYEPDAILATTADEARLVVGFNGWPWKTATHILPNKVTVEHGQGSGLTVVWSRA